MLPRLLKDLTRQIYRDFEVIVVDGGSKDKTIVKALSFKEKLPGFRLEKSPRANVCSQRNLGARLAQYQILVFIDADTRIEPEFLLGLRYRWETSHTDLLSFWLKGDVNNRQYDSIALAMNLFRELQNNLQTRYLLEALIAVDKSCFFDCGGFNEKINYAEGGALIKTLINKGYSSKIVRDPVYTYSLRRMRQMGLLKITASIARLELSHLFGKDYPQQLIKKLYPMTGGSQFLNAQKTKHFMEKIKTLMSSISRSF